MGTQFGEGGAHGHGDVAEALERVALVRRLGGRPEDILGVPPPPWRGQDAGSCP